YKFGGAIGECVGPRANRFVLQVTLEIVGKFSDRGVSLLRTLLQSFANNGVQISTKFAAEFICGGAPSLSDEAAAVRCNCVRGARRLKVEHSPYQFRRRVRT